MRRSVLLGLAALAASACTYGSAIDIAPFDARVAHAVLPPGDYCEMTLGASPRVNSSDGCLRLAWDDARRIHVMTDLETTSPGKSPSSGEVERHDLAIVALGDHLYAAQFDESGASGRHELVTFLAMGDAVAGVGMVDDATLRRLVAAHPQMVWEDLPAQRPPEAPAQLVTSHPLIRSASVNEIKAFLREATAAALREDKPDLDELPSVGVRDTAGAPDHAPSPGQAEAGRKLLELIAQMRR